MQCQHLHVKVEGRRGTCQGSVKVMEVTSGFFDVTRRAIGVKHAMTCYHCSRMQGLDLIQRAEPLAPGLFIALREIEVRVVVDSIPRYNQANRRHMQRSCVRRVGMAKVYLDRQVSGRRSCRGQGPGQCDRARAGRRLPPRFRSLRRGGAQAGGGKSDPGRDEARFPDPRRGNCTSPDAGRPGRPLIEHVP